MEQKTVSLGKITTILSVTTLDNLARHDILSMKWIIHIDHIREGHRVSKKWHF